MFGVFSDGNFIGFWANKKEDNWAAITVKKINLVNPEIFWYESPKVECPAHYRFDESKNLVIQEQNEAGEIVDTATVYAAEPYSF